jgi:hypothetical protein
MEVLSIEERLKRLEEENKRLRLLALGVVVLSGGSLLLAAATAVRARLPQPVRIVEAERFVLRDASGKTRAVLGMDADGLGLRFYDASGKVRAVLGLIADWPRLTLSDASGKPRAWLEGTPDGAALDLTDASGKPRAELSVDELFGPGLSIGYLMRAALDLNVTADGPAITVTDAQGFKAVIGHAVLQDLFTGEQRTTPAASIHLFDRAGKVIWHAP